MTATGMLADTVRPTFSTRYMLDAPNMMPSSVPTMIGVRVNSLGVSDAGTNGWKSGGAGADMRRLVGRWTATGTRGAE